MKFTMEVKKEYDVRVLEVVAGVRYWENGEVNGKEDTNGEIPCRVGENWEIKINIETGQILNWEKGNTAKVHYKVCDAGSYTLINEKGEDILEIDDAYVPSCLSIDDKLLYQLLHQVQYQ